jgi:hypothetical protein
MLFYRVVAALDKPGQSSIMQRHTPYQNTTYFKIRQHHTTNKYIQTDRQTHLNTHTHTHTHTHTYAHILTPTFIHTHTRTHVHIQMHAYTRIYLK